MNRQYHIRVYGTQRQNIDPALLAQVVILLGRHLHQQHHHQHNHRAGQDATASQDCPPARHHGELDMARSEPLPDNTPLTPRNNDGELS
jgi:hypothetical protein